MKEFLKEYKKLVEKHELFLQTCGCCDSPWVYNVQERLEFVNEGRKRRKLPVLTKAELIEEFINHLKEDEDVQDTPEA